jgi:hypothetical protein
MGPPNVYFSRKNIRVDNHRVVFGTVGFIYYAKQPASNRQNGGNEKGVPVLQKKYRFKAKGDSFRFCFASFSENFTLPFPLLFASIFFFSLCFASVFSFSLQYFSFRFILLSQFFFSL